MKNYMKPVAVISLGLLLSACSGLDTKDDEPAVVEEGGSSASTTPVDSGTAITSAATGLGVIDGMRIDEAGSPDYVRTVYFEYDSSEVRSEFIPLIAAHAELLASDSSRRIVLEGHADERGSREYNIALGERRGLSVRRLLLSSGAQDSQIRVVSYGEERPAMEGHNENAWSKNRRVEVRYE